MRACVCACMHVYVYVCSDTAEAAQLEAGGDARATSVASSNGGEGQTSMCAGATSHEVCLCVSVWVQA